MLSESILPPIQDKLPTNLARLAAAPHSAPQPLNQTNDVPMDPDKGHMHERSSFIDGLASDIWYATKELRGQCVYGKNCGSKCSTYGKGKGR